jgi:hypothetical protein
MTAIDELRLAMERAAAAMNFEEASRLRDQISVLRLAGGEAKVDVEDIDTSGLTRQQPGAMGLGTSQQTMTPPAGWVRPKKPDPLTANRSRRPGKKR